MRSLAVFLCMCITAGSSVQTDTTDILGLSYPLYLNGKVVEAQEDDVVCFLCTSGTDFIKSHIETGGEYVDVRDVLISECEDLFANSTTNRFGDMCEGWMDNYVPHWWYILEVRDMSAIDACRGIHFCDPEVQQQVQLPAPKGSVEDAPAQIKKQKHEESNVIKVMHLSDVHMDHEYATGSPTDCGLYLCCRDRYEGQGAARAWGEYRCNLPIRTLELFLHEMEATDADLVLYTGDTPPHHMWEETQELQLSYSRSLTQILGRIMPNSDIYTVIGNHDTYPTNLYYMNRTEIQELNVAIGEWWTDLSGLDEEQLHTLEEGGYYTILHQPGLRIVSYNSIYRYASNFYNLISLDHPAYVKMQAFMYSTFEAAREANEKVLLIGHIPPGRHTTVDFAEWFRDFVLEFSDLIVLNLYGHTHTDYFSLYLDDDNIARSVQLVTPSVTTLYNRNPSARVYWLDADTYDLLDYKHYWLDLDETTDDESQPPQIHFSYSPIEAYDMEDLTPASWQNLAERLSTDDDLLSLFYQHYEVHTVEADSCDDICRRDRLCEIYFINYEQIVSCKQGTP